MKKLIVTQKYDNKKLTKLCLKSENAKVNKSTTSKSFFSNAFLNDSIIILK